MTTFTETQQNPFRWYLLAFAVLCPSLLGQFSKFFEHFGDGIWGALLGFCVYCLLSVGFIYIVAFKKIVTHLNKQSIRFRVTPFGKWVTIEWDAIKRAYVREFALIGEYPKGLGGTRQGPNGWAYTISGTYGLQINKKSGGKILIGTQRPDELKAFLSSFPATITA